MATTTLTDRPIDVINSTLSNLENRLEMLARFCETKAESYCDDDNKSESRFWHGLMDELDRAILDCQTVDGQADQLWEEVKGAAAR